MADVDRTTADPGQTESERDMPVLGQMLDKDGRSVSGTSYSPYYQLQVGGFASIRDLADQFSLSLVNSGLPQPVELAFLRTGLQVPPIESPYHRNALARVHRTSCVLVGWTILEATANVMAELAIATSNKVAGSPPVAHQLTPQEVDYLREQETYFDAEKHQTKVRQKFVPTLYKLATFPKLLSDVLGVKVILDRGGRGWQSMIRAKEVRDSLMHPKLGTIPLNSIIGSSIVITVQDDDIVHLVTAMAWFLSTTYPLMKSMFAGLALGTIQIAFMEVCNAYGRDSDRVAEEYGFRMNQTMG